MSTKEPEPGPPYPGPPAQYQFVNTQVTIGTQISFSFTQTHMVTSDINTYYPFLGAQYAQGYRLLSFYRIPGQTRVTGFMNATVAVPFQGIFCRYPNVPTHEKWHLHIEKSVIQTQRMVSGIITFNTQRGVVSDTSHIMESIARNTQGGGRLICIEMTGQQQSQSTRLAYSGLSPVMGVDLFFEKPEHPMPEQFVYNCVCVPINVTYQGGFRPVPVVQCDWLGVLAQNLSQGWRLIEIFMDMTCSTQAHGFSATQTLNSMWFFEKAASRMNDSTPVYQGTVVPHEIIINAGFGGTTTSAHWEPVIEKMGSRGWELACILETPESHISGMASIARKCLLFFQRRILPPVGVAPGAIGFNLPPPPPYDSMPAGYGQVQPGLYQPPPPPPEYK